MPPPLLAAPAPAPALTQRARRILAAINKIKEELMLMGFISLMLLACEDQITYFQFIGILNLNVRQALAYWSYFKDGDICFRI